MVVAKKKRKPLSLRLRFLLSTTLVILIISLSYGSVAIFGYMNSFDRTNYRLLRSESNLFFSLAQWKNNRLTIAIPPDFDLNYPTLVLIYNQQGELLWRQRDIPTLESHVDKSWLQTPGIYDMYIDKLLSYQILDNDQPARQRLKNYEADGDQETTHSLSVNHYQATSRLPALTIVVIDIMPQELQPSDTVWDWLAWVILANLVLVIPFVWIAAHWSLRPINQLARQVAQLENNQRELLDENTPKETHALVRSLNILLYHERKRYAKYHTTLSDLTHSLKTPLAVMQTTLQSLRIDKSITIADVESIILEQISRISQQVGYYLHRASIHSDHSVVTREIHSLTKLLDGLCYALHKVYSHKGVAIRLNISPEMVFMGNNNDFIEIMGNLLDNACKYCLELVEISAEQSEGYLNIYIDDDGPGIPFDKRSVIFLRGQRADTLKPGQGLGLTVASEIIEQYQGDIIISDSNLGGARIQASFGYQ
ncbi:two-component system sensor histidine kinase PhoQ [Budvicia diplopodorum]|uniref:two-component system sensor histidine kinase PhoQ n=1 Tax=Budvicia diplopodorum TaxID=1119056 RepID=UPI00135B0984|nr:two-component system sensor histidine kinase PhoQ [Budvicia diplopodorum]